MRLNDWLKQGLLTTHRATHEEIADLLALADRDLRQCQAEALGPDWRLAIAYNAALQCATAALAAAGYRAAREAHHYRVIQSLECTLGWDADAVSALDAFRKKRHTAGYERAGAISEQEAREMLRIAQKLRQDIEAWLAQRHPDLV